MFSHTKEMVHRFMTWTAYGSKPNSMNRMFHMRTYGMKICMTTAAEGMVMLQGEKICIGQIRFTMNELRCMVHGLCEILKDTQNTFSVDGPRWMCERMLRESRMRTAIVRERGSINEIRCVSERVHGYFQDIRTFKEELFTLVHMTVVAPARGTEIISIKHRNSGDERGG